MLHQRAEAWETRLNELLKRVDRALEQSFGSLLARHPARAAPGSAANPQQDGLFRVTASFTPGFGSVLGKGYVIRFDTVTLQDLPATQRAAIEQHAVQLIQEGLEEALPGRSLAVKRDGSLWKIVGDLSLSTRAH